MWNFIKIPLVFLESHYVYGQYVAKLICLFLQICSRKMQNINWLTFLISPLFRYDLYIYIYIYMCVCVCVCGVLLCKPDYISNYCQEITRNETLKVSLPGKWGVSRIGARNHKYRYFTQGAVMTISAGPCQRSRSLHVKMPDYTATCWLPYGNLKSEV
jgi:hypothetical protein